MLFPPACILWLWPLFSGWRISRHFLLLMTHCCTYWMVMRWNSLAETAWLGETMTLLQQVISNLYTKWVMGVETQVRKAVTYFHIFIYLALSDKGFHVTQHLSTVCAQMWDDSNHNIKPQIFKNRFAFIPLEICGHLLYQDWHCACIRGESWTTGWPAKRCEHSGFENVDHAGQRQVPMQGGNPQWRWREYICLHLRFGPGWEPLNVISLLFSCLFSIYSIKYRPVQKLMATFFVEFWIFLQCLLLHRSVRFREQQSIFRTSPSHATLRRGPQHL